MTTKPANYSLLHDRDERLIARFAAKARANTIWGGCSALVIAKRLQRMNPRSEALSVVKDVYSASTGRHHTEFEAWECPECGSAHLGQDKAAQCCQERFED